MAKQIAITGSAVDFIDTPRPEMMLVAWPVCEAAATLLHRRIFGRGVVLGDHDHRRGQREADERAAEHVQLQVRASAVFGTSFSVMNQNAAAEMRPDTITPLYSAFMILPPSEVFTKNVPTMEETMDAAPSASGYKHGVLAHAGHHEAA